MRQSQCKRGVGCRDRGKAWGGWLFMATMLAWVSYKLPDEDPLWGWQLSHLSTPLEPVPFLEPQLAPVMWRCHWKTMCMREEMFSILKVETVLSKVVAGSGVSCIRADVSSVVYDLEVTGESLGIRMQPMSLSGL